MKIHVRESVLVIAGVFLSSAAAAATLDPPQLIVELAFNLGARQSTNAFGPIVLEDANFGTLSILSTAFPSPQLIADATIGPNAIASVFGRADALLNYGVEVLGPPGDVVVLIDVTGGASAFANAGASFAVEARWDLLDGGTSLAGDDIRSGQLTGGFSQGFERTVSLTLAANHAYTVFMLADTASAGTLAGSQARAHAFVDPVFRLGSGVDAGVYSFLFSPGIGNTAAAVPEPLTFGLVGAGLVLLGLVPRRGRIGCAVASLALVISSADAQSFTTQSVTLSGSASMRAAAANRDTQVAAFDLSPGDEGGDRFHRGTGSGPGPAVPVPSARVAAANPELALSFDGLRMIDARLADNGNAFSYEPPDQGLCAGNGFVLESVNGAMRTYDTSGNSLAGITSTTPSMVAPWQSTNRLANSVPPSAIRCATSTATRSDGFISL